MARKFYVALVPALASIAFAVGPAVAKASVPHWYLCEAKSGGKYEDGKCTKEASTKTFEWVRIKEGTKAKPNKVAFKAKGTLTPTDAGGLAIDCKYKEAGNIWNPAGGGAGEDEITEFVSSECTSNSPECPEPEYVALGLPWKSQLLVDTPIRDEILGWTWELRCGKQKANTYTGNLRPEVGSSVFVFDVVSGALEDPDGDHLGITGTINIEGPAGAVGITAKAP